MILKVYGDSISGNCLKVKWTAKHLGLPFEWIETSAIDGSTRTDAFLRMNAAGQVPTVILPDGRPLAQSNAIILHLADGSDLIPADPYRRAKMLEWLFWEQYSHEPYVAVVRFQVRFQGKPVSEVEPRLIERGHAALRRLNDATVDGGFLVGETVSLADVALIAYSRWAEEGGFDLSAYPAMTAWIARTERALGIEDERG